MNTHGRLAVWLQEHFSFFKLEPLFDRNLIEYLQGSTRELIPSACHALSYDGSFGVVVESNLGCVLYKKEKVRTGQRVIVEEVELIPRTGKGLSLTIVNNELSIIRHNGSDPEYSPNISAKEMVDISVFVNQLRLKTEEFMRAGRR